MFILKKGHQPGVYVPLRALFLVFVVSLVNKWNNRSALFCMAGYARHTMCASVIPFIHQ